MHGVQRNTQTHAKSSKGAMTHFQGASQQLNAALHIFQCRAFRMAVGAVQIPGQRLQLCIRAGAVVLHIDVQGIRFGFKPKLDMPVFHFFYAMVIGIFKHGL